MNKEFLHAFFASAPAALAVLDAELHFIQVNQVFLKTFELSSEWPVQQSIYAVLPQLAEQLQSPLEQAIQNNNVIETEVNLTVNKQCIKRLTTTCFPITNPDSQQISGAGLILVDVEEHRRLEAKLRQSQKMEAIGRLAGGVAHDFNNLLMVIQFASHRLIKLTQGNKRAYTELQDIIKATENAGSLTRQLLAFGRMQVLEPKTVNLSDALLEVRRLLDRTLGDNIELSINTEPSLIIRVDPVQLDLIVLNLAINARDAMPSGGKLTINAHKQWLNAEDIADSELSHPGPYAVLTVSDTGSGIASETMEYIFDPFFTTKDRHEGTGLGLSTTHGFVSQSGGTIRVTSIPNHGTTFEILLPIVDNEVAETPELPNFMPQFTQTQQRILLVEDEPTVLKLMHVALKEAGYQVIEVANGNEALRLVEEQQEVFNLLISDVMMPGISGLKLADRLSKIHPTMPILLVSGYAQDNPLLFDHSDTAYHFMQKPFQPLELTNKVNKILQTGAVNNLQDLIA